MSVRTGIDKVRDCLSAVRPDIDLDAIGDDTPLLEDRVITSFDVLDLLLHLERASGRALGRRHLRSGSFRDLRTIARLFFDAEPGA